MAAATPGARSNPFAEAYTEFITLFANVLFAVSLFAVWGVLTVIGVIVDQGKDPGFYWQNYAPPLARLVLRLDLDNIYHSTAYVGIIGLILASLAVCTFKRVIPARLPPLRAVKIDKIPLHASVTVRGEEEAVRGRVNAFFTGRGWQVRNREIGGSEWTFADKHNWARRGVLVAHAGFVIIAAGTSIYWAKGFSGTTAVISGQSITIPETNARITLQKFGYRIDPVQTKSGTVFQPIDYVSDLVYTGRDGVAQHLPREAQRPSRPAALVQEREQHAHPIAAGAIGHRLCVDVGARIHARADRHAAAEVVLLIARCDSQQRLGVGPHEPPQP